MVEAFSFFSINTTILIINVKAMSGGSMFNITNVEGSLRSGQDKTKCQTATISHGREALRLKLFCCLTSV